MAEIIGLNNMVLRSIIDMLNKVLVLFLLIIIQSNSAYATTAIDVLNQYCKYDLSGYRLDSNGMHKIRDFYAWDEKERYEPGWDCFLVISGFDVESIVEKANIAHAVIKYEVIGAICSANILSKKRYTDEVSIEMVKIDGNWKLKDFIISPRVSIDTAVNYINNVRCGKKKREECKEKQMNLIAELEKIRRAIKGSKEIAPGLDQYEMGSEMSEKG